MKKLLAVTLFVLIGWFQSSAVAQTIEANFLIVSSAGEVQIQQISNSTVFTDCLGCHSLLAWCSATCVLDTVINHLTSEPAENVDTIQVVKYTNGSFAAFERTGQNISFAGTPVLLYDFGPLAGGRDAILNECLRQ